MKWRLELIRAPRFVQREFAYWTRARRLERLFKRALVLITIALLALVTATSQLGRTKVVEFATSARWAVLGLVGLEPDRGEIDSRWRARRELGVALTRPALRRAFDQAEPGLQKLMIYSGLDPEHALLRWGNFDRTLLLPSTTFEADDRGRSYRLKPNVRSVWLRHITLKEGVLGFFLVPDRPELPAAMEGSGAIRVDGSEQTTNSWGCRGPEPNPNATLRGLVLGDSFMQALFIGDNDVPSENLRRLLHDHYHVDVSILNTGVLGYSPEQYYYSMIEYFDRIKPQFVIMSVFANDFGNEFEVIEGGGDRDEARYWFGEIAQFCRTRGVLQITVPVPFEMQLASARKEGYYPGIVSNLSQTTGLTYVNPIESFVNMHLKKTAERIRAKQPTVNSPLFNGEIADGHFSPLGSKVWADVVGERLILLLDRLKLTGRLKISL